MRQPLRAGAARWLCAWLGSCCAALASASSERPTTDDTGWGELPEVGEKDDSYFASLRGDYKYKPIDHVAYTVQLRLDPCRIFSLTGGLGFRCCANTNNLANCQHHTDIEAGMDLQFAYFTNAHIPNCRGTAFEKSPDCGTYVEIHRLHPSEAEYHKVLHDRAVDQKAFLDGFQTSRISTYKLCLGEHELWWVVRTRAGPYVLLKLPFMVVTPSCEGPAHELEAPEFAIPPPEIP